MKKYLFSLIILINIAAMSIPALNMEAIKTKVWPAQVVRWNLKEGKELIIVAKVGASDMASLTHQSLKQIFENDKPDVYLMEGFCGSREGESPERLKKKSTEICEKKGACGENLYAAYLATKNNIRFIGAELSEKTQVPLLRGHGYTKEDVIFYLLVQQLPYFFRDGDFKTHTQKFTPDTWESMCNNFIDETISEWLDEKVPLTYQDFLVWWKHNFGNALDMEREFSNFERGERYHEANNGEHAMFTQKMAYWFHKNRDDYKLGLIQSTISDKDSKKILVVLGTNHLKALWDKFMKAYGEPTSRAVL